MSILWGVLALVYVIAGAFTGCVVAKHAPRNRGFGRWFPPVVTAGILWWAFWAVLLIAALAMYLQRKKTGAL